jgi:integrase
MDRSAERLLNVEMVIRKSSVLILRRKMLGKRITTDRLSCRLGQFDIASYVLHVAAVVHAGEEELLGDLSETQASPVFISGVPRHFGHQRGGCGNLKIGRSARITCNSTLRQAKSIFSRKIVKFASAGMALPEPLPFAEVAFFPRESMRYQSKIDPEALLRTASRELAESDRDAFLALILALGGGLRRGEIDKLLWRQVDCYAGVIHIEATEVGKLKSSDSAGDVAIDSALSSILQGFRARAKAQFVIEEGTSSRASQPWGRSYRCENVFKRLTNWMRVHGIESNKPLHMLRKEAGSLIATKSGIFAASRFLRHADIQLTAMHYADHKERVTVNTEALLLPENVIELEKSDDKSLVRSAKKRQ